MTEIILWHAEGIIQDILREVDKEKRTEIEKIIRDSADFRRKELCFFKENHIPLYMSRRLIYTDTNIFAIVSNVRTENSNIPLEILIYNRCKEYIINHLKNDYSIQLTENNVIATTTVQRIFEETKNHFFDRYFAEEYDAKLRKTISSYLWDYIRGITDNILRQEKLK